MERVVEDIVARSQHGRVRVGVDGMCGSGKTTTAAVLTRALLDRGIEAVHISSDGFHMPRAVRYRAGRTSARGYYRDTYDLEALRADVLEPLAPGGSGRYAPAVFDLHADRACTIEWRQAPPAFVLVYDGSFSLRRELVDHWDVRVLIDTPRAICESRMLARDTHLGDDALELIRERYHGAWDIHVHEASLRELAGVHVL